MDTTQKLPFTIQYVKSDQTPGAIDVSDHAPELTVDPATVAEVVDLVVDAPAGRITGALSALAVGAATFSCVADADLGAGVESDVTAGPASFSVSEEMVSGATIEFGAAVPK